MKQTKFQSDEHAFNDMHGRMLSEYKKAVEQYKDDIASGKVKAPEFPVHVEAPQEKPPSTSTHNERKETEQARLI